MGLVVLLLQFGDLIIAESLKFVLSGVFISLVFDPDFNFAPTPIVLVVMILFGSCGSRGS